MQFTLKDLPKSQKEARVTVEAAELAPFMEHAAQELSQRTKIEGFRPGKASYDIVKGRYGEMAILEEALPAIVQKHLVKIVLDEKLDTIGEPVVNVEKAAPGNEVIFTAKLTLLPKITKLADVRKIKIDTKSADVPEAEIDKVLGELRKMQSTEHDVEREVVAGDKVVVDMDMKIDKVPVEGGQAKNHSIYTSEPYYVPGLNEKLYGMKKGETRLFMLKFPDDHFNKQFAGKEVEFEVSLKGILEIRHPELDDAFAKSVGQPNLAEMRALLRKNLETEARTKEEQRQEIAVIEELIRGSAFEDLPETLLNSEAHKMLHELEHAVEKQGGAFADYLKQIKKTRDDLLLGFAPEAAKRVKTTLLVREIGKRENLEPTDPELVEEQTQLLNMYKEDAATQERIRTEEGLEYIRSVLRNRKVLKFLRETAVKK